MLVLILEGGRIAAAEAAETGRLTLVPAVLGADPDRKPAVRSSLGHILVDPAGAVGLGRMIAGRRAAVHRNRLAADRRIVGRSLAGLGRRVVGRTS